MAISREASNTGGSSQRSSSTSRSLLAGVRADEPAAWRRLVKLYSPLILHWCRAEGLTGQDAADVYQDVFRAVVANIGRFRRERPQDTFRGWLRRITQNKVRDHFRRRERGFPAAGGSSVRRRLEQTPAREEDDGDLPHAIEQESALVARALDMIQCEFEPRTWRAFWETVVIGRHTKDVAVELAMSPGAVRVARCRVLHRLRFELGDLSY